MYSLVEYGSMLADSGRTAAYASALTARITPASVVLDIGTGPGLMALLACHSGAARVYAVESDDVIQVARELATANGCADRIRFVQAMTTDVDLPERVDGIVADLHGTLPLFGTSLVSILDARDRFLKPGGWIVPVRETLWAALASSAWAHALIIGAWNGAYGIDFSSVRTRAANHWCKMSLAAEDLLVPPRCWATLEYASLQGANVSGDLTWIVDRAAVGHGIAAWFDAETAHGTGFSNSPAVAEDHVYGHAFFPWPEPLSLAEGDEVRVRLRADFVGADYIWTWNTDVADPSSGRIKTTHRQSSFLGAPLAPERLRKRGHNVVADLSDDGKIDRAILGLMDGTLSLDTIAKKILAAFPSHFADWNTALERVGELSSRYTK